MRAKNVFPKFESMIVCIPAISFITIIFSVESIAMSYINHNWLGMAIWFAVGFISISITKLISRRLNTN